MLTRRPRNMPHGRHRRGTREGPWHSLRLARHAWLLLFAAQVASAQVPGNQGLVVRDEAATPPVLTWVFDADLRDAGARVLVADLDPGADRPAREWSPWTNEPPSKTIRAGELTRRLRSRPGAPALRLARDPARRA